MIDEVQPILSKVESDEVEQQTSDWGATIFWIVIVLIVVLVTTVTAIVVVIKRKLKLAKNDEQIDW